MRDIGHCRCGAGVAGLADVAASQARRRLAATARAVSMRRWSPRSGPRRRVSAWPRRSISNCRRRRCSACCSRSAGRRPASAPCGCGGASAAAHARPDAAFASPAPARLNRGQPEHTGGAHDARAHAGLAADGRPDSRSRAQATFPRREVVTRSVEGPISRTTYANIWRRAKQVTNALQERGIQLGDRVATLAWNTERHLEAWYGDHGHGRGAAHGEPAPVPRPDRLDRQPRRRQDPVLRHHLPADRGEGRAAADDGEDLHRVHRPRAPAAIGRAANRL